MKQNFALIKTLDDLLPHIAGKEQIRVQKQDNGTTIVCYMIDDGELFGNHYELECRGLVFDKDGKIICRPLHKFFNLNENEKTSINNLNFNKITRIMDKLDGSMLTPALVDGKIKWKTKKKFDSDVSIAAQKFVDTQPNINLFCQEILNEYTPIFEFTTPQQRIVIHYQTSKMVLLHVRNLITGEYQDLTSDYWQKLIHKHNIETVKETKLNNDGHQFVVNMIADLKTAKDLEGYVIQFEDGNMVKLKSDWYLDLHRVMTFLRERDVAELVVLEKIDDVKAALIAQGASILAIEEIQKRVADKLLNIEKTVEEFYTLNKDKSKKEVAIANKGHEYFGLIMSKMSGNNPDYKEYFLRNYLKQDFSLKSMNVIEDNLFKKSDPIETSERKMKF